MTPTGLFIGLTTFDLIHYVERFPRADEKIQALARWTGAGGPAANAAAAFAALGGHATLLTAIGTGPLAKAALEDMTGLGVDVIDLATGGELATSSAAVDLSGRRIVVSLNAKGFDQGAMAQRLPVLEPADVVSLDAHFPTVASALLADLPSPRPPVVFDPGSDKPHLPELMDMSDHVIASGSLDAAAQRGDLLERVRTHDVTLAAVSAGPAPILAAIGDHRFEIPVPQIPASDTLGAGDVLHGAYAYYIATGCSAHESLERAANVAARSCERHGPRVESAAGDVNGSDSG
ncbi:MAG: PfkB family carbohydrate kinase [Solirubrobacterales bacterium]